MTTESRITREMQPLKWRKEDFRTRSVSIGVDVTMYFAAASIVDY